MGGFVIKVTAKKERKSRDSSNNKGPKKTPIIEVESVTIPPHIKRVWFEINQNFTTRHKGIKKQQKSLWALYEVMDGWVREIK